MKLPDSGERAAKIASYAPRHVDAATWRVIGPLVRFAVSKVVGTDPDPSFLLSSNSRFVAWAYERGLDVTDVEAVYRPEHLERFVAEDRDTVLKASRSSIRGAIARTGIAATKRAPWPARKASFPRSKLKAPYSANERRLLARCVEAQTVDVARRAAEALECLGLGVGPDAGELFDICGGSVLRYRGFVCVEIARDRPRRVPVRSAYADRVLALAEAFPHQPLIAPWSNNKNRVSKAADRIQRGRTTPPFNAARFRNSWLVDLMADGVPNAVILDAAGLTTLASLSDLVRYLPPVDQADAYLRLAGDLDGER